MRRRTFGVGVLGGTFDHLHRGHRRLLTTAFQRSIEVRIGLTTDRYLEEHPKPWPDRIQRYALRRSALTRWLRAEFPERRWRIVPLSDRWGGSVAPGVDAVFATRDTRAGVLSVNRERRRRGLAALRVVLVPRALAVDRRPISSRRIRAGGIDPEGRRRSRARH